ncbi:MAG: RluA family pseudouridine synthase [Pseudomonadota bacterium]
MSGVQHRTVGADEAEQRLDRWFRRHFPQISQGMLEKLCRRGAVRVDGGRAKPASRVGPGQTVRVPPLPETPAPAPAPPQAGAAPPDPALAELLQAAVVYRDDHMLVIDKPPGLAVQGGSKQRRHVAGGLAALRFGRDDDPRLVHRLDRDTSGLLVLARTGAAAVALSRAFRSRAVAKTYVAAVAGRPKPAAGTLRWGLVKAGGRGVEKMTAVHPDAIASTPGAQAARTEYTAVESAGQRASVVALRPVTGRTHQLRVHMAALGTPIVGDGKYGGRGQENAGDGWGASLGGEVSRKLHLHALRLTLPHPATGARISVAAPLPSHMARTWAFFGWSTEALADDPFALADL